MCIERCMLWCIDVNPLAWSVRNQLAIGLGNQVYLWNGDDGSVLSLMELSRSSEYISSVGWGKKGSYLAIGTSYSHIQIWDINKQQKLREIKTGQSCRVGCVDWNSFNLARYVVFCSKFYKASFIPVDVKMGPSAFMMLDKKKRWLLVRSNMHWKFVV